MGNNSKQLFVLRHAKADWDMSVPDFDRPLTSNGKKHAQKLGFCMQQQALIPDLVLSSAAKRAIDTASLVCEQLRIDSEQIHINNSFYDADEHEILAAVKQIPAHYQTALLVGHNPAFEQLIAYLADEPFVSDLDSGKLMLPATLVILDFEGSWSDLVAHHCHLNQRIHGKHLR
ncbi:SixA phosphatase family protein [Methylophaga sp. OBS4]|uniref:SixA phosphatase family protein n=1 Tax=Methylophaga sp. OBS4 TaxID=2991935 RepID=UPI002256C40E|nr:histidine phosphatase family protein [Methylophaga sp. OBS4]MCX4186723.1 histidine phosphatase family protein [Methylophaga sp. OBS4]